MLTLKEIQKELKGKTRNCKIDIKIKGVSIDSRTIKRDNLFIAIKGANYDGHNFINKAINKGASVIVVSKNILLSKKVPTIVVKDTTKALGKIASVYRNKFNIPILESKQLKAFSVI